MTYMFFFFSSRRRHTRSKRDWSSDVCSSDLPRRVGSQYPSSLETRQYQPTQYEPRGWFDPPAWRSEERRVGKEGRSRGAPDDEEKMKKERKREVEDANKK